MNFLDIEQKVDSQAKLAQAYGKPTENYLFAAELNKIVQAINTLKGLQLLNQQSITAILTQNRTVGLAEVDDVLTAFNALPYRQMIAPVYITATIDNVDYVYAFTGTNGYYGAGRRQLMANDIIMIYRSDEQAPVVLSLQDVTDAGATTTIPVTFVNPDDTTQTITIDPTQNTIFFNGLQSINSTYLNYLDQLGTNLLPIYYQDIIRITQTYGLKPIIWGDYYKEVFYDAQSAANYLYLMVVSGWDYLYYNDQTGECYTWFNHQSVNNITVDLNGDTGLPYGYSNSLYIQDESGFIGEIVGNAFENNTPSLFNKTNIFNNPNGFYISIHNFAYNSYCDFKFKYLINNAEHSFSSYKENIEIENIDGEFNLMFSDSACKIIIENIQNFGTNFFNNAQGKIEIKKLESSLISSPPTDIFATSNRCVIVLPALQVSTTDTIYTTIASNAPNAIILLQ